MTLLIIYYFQPSNEYFISNLDDKNNFLFNICSYNLNVQFVDMNFCWNWKQQIVEKEFLINCRINANMKGVEKMNKSERRDLK